MKGNEWMAIRYDSAAKTLTIQTVKSTYQMKVDEHGALLHTYFGAPVEGQDLFYLIAADEHSFSGQPGDVADDRTYSLDYYPQEYSVYGNGDYRMKALRAGKKGSVPALDLRYHSHKIRSGKYSLPGLPAMFADEPEKAETLEITLKDLYEDIYVKLLYGVFAEKGVLTRAAVVENRTEDKWEIRRAMSMNLDFLEGNLELVHFHGKHAGERQFERANLCHGITEIRSTRGTSGHQHNPFVMLCEPDATEDYGGCYGFSLLYSGGFQIQIERDQLDSARILCGLSDEEFLWPLDPGESFFTPETAFIYTESGMADLSNSLKKAYQQHLIRSSWKNKKRPTLVNNWEATYFDFNAEKLLDIASQASELGLDMLVLDDGWFGKRNDDTSGLGDWFVNEEKLGCTLKEFVDRINEMGLKFGIWIEPEMVSEDSELYRKRPDWALQIPGRIPNRGRNQLALDMSNPDVIRYLKKCLDDIIGSCNVEYVKWDINRCIDNVYSAAAPGSSQGAVRHQCVLGVYELHEHLLSRHPHILLEGCNGGGGRFDAGMLYYAPQIWCSDNTDAIERLRIHYGTSFGYPMSAVSAHVSACPNHQNGRVTPFKTRGICSMQGSFGYELNLSKLSEEEKAEARRQIEIYNENYELFQFGDYYRLSSPFANRDFTAWSFVSEDKGKAFLGVVYTDLHANARPLRVKWRGLDGDAFYEMDGKTYAGSVLMKCGTVLPKPQCNYDSYMVVIHKK